MTQQNVYNFSTQYEWEENGSLTANTLHISKGQDFLSSVRITNIKNPNELLFEKDSIHIKSGLHNTSNTFEFQEQLDSLPYILLITSWKKSSDSTFLLSQVDTIRRRPIKKPQLLFNDTSLFIKSDSGNTFKLSFFVRAIENEKILDAKEFTLKQDTLIPFITLFKKSVFQNHSLIIETSLNEKIISKDTLYYRYGKLFNFPLKKNVIEKDKVNRKWIKGTLSAENQSFSADPFHANQNQFPFTTIQTLNQIEIAGIPLNLDFSYTSNQNVSPNFRNFFSVKLNKEELNRRLKKLETETITNQNNLPSDVNNNIESNFERIKTLERFQDLSKKYPDQNHHLDSILIDDLRNLKHNQSQDSLLLSALDTNSLSIDSNEKTTRSSRHTDSLNRNSERIEYIIAQYKKSNRFKKQFLREIKKDTNLIREINPNSLKSTKYQEKLPFLSFMNRFEELEIGNFYKEAGRYSIFDVELEGVNLSYQVNEFNQVNVLYGRINNFQSLNLNDRSKRTQISSYSVRNTNLSILNFEIRYTNFSNELINNELKKNTDNYNLISLNLNGKIGSKIDYTAESNLNHSLLNQTNSNSELANFQGSNFSLNYQACEYLSFGAQTSQVGKNYKSDGVYFLIRDYVDYGLKAHAQIFKKKLQIKVSRLERIRNVSSSELNNKTTNYFYEISTRFKRYPNLQIIHSPVTIKIANTIDTTFSGINANSEVSIGRLSYLKKIKKSTLYSSFVFVRLNNEIYNNTDTQSNIQHFSSFDNEKVSLSYTVAFNNGFNRFQFYSLGSLIKISSKLQWSTHFSQNFNNTSPYRLVFRNGLEGNLSQHIILRGSIAALIGNSNNIDLGNIVSLQFRY